MHAATLLGDGYLRPSVADVVVPFASAYKEPWTSIGIGAGWGLVLLGLGFYARGRIGVARWRAAHRFTALAWIAGIAHALGEGTDAGSTWFLVLVAVTALPAAVLLAVRLAPRRSVASRAAPLAG